MAADGDAAAGADAEGGAAGRSSRSCPEEYADLTVDEAAAGARKPAEEKMHGRLPAGVRVLCCMCAACWPRRVLLAVVCVALRGRCARP